MQIGIWDANWQSAAKWRLACKLAFGLQLEFWLKNGVQICSKTGHSFFPAPHIVCFPDNRPCGVCRAAPRLRPCEQLTDPAVFARRQLDCVPANRAFGLFGAIILCFPENRPCGFSGAATRLRPCQQALRTLQGRASRAFLTAGPAVFAGQHL